MPIRRKTGQRGFRTAVSHLQRVWHAIWSLDVSALEKVVRAILVYGFLVIAIRVVGRRELGQTNTLDLVVLLLIANAVQNGIIGNDISVTGAFLGAAALMIVNEAVNRTAYFLPWTEGVLEGDPTYLVRNGKPDTNELFRSAISLPELRAIARRQGFTGLDEVRTAILETNGAVSMFSKDVELSGGG